MDKSFDLNTFLHCPQRPRLDPQGPRLEGEVRANVLQVLGRAIPQGFVMTAARLLMQDPSLITEMISEESCFPMKPAVEVASHVDLDAFVLFALAHGMPVTDPSFGDPRGLLARAIYRNSPGLVGCALLYQADPNQLTDCEWDCSLLDKAVTNVFAYRTNSAKFASAIQIVHMLLDAGANPDLPGANNNAIYTLCLNPWEGNAEVLRIFTEIMKRTTIKNASDKKSIIIRAILSMNFPAAIALLEAGAPVDAPVDVVEINRILKTNDISEDFPAFIEQYGKSPANNATSTVSTYQSPQLNLVPEGFLTMGQGLRLEGEARADACRLLDMAITQGLFVTTTKILSMDPSLITESLGEDGLPKQPAMQKAIAAGMTALVPFALTHGMGVDDPVFSARGLLEMGIKRSSPSLMSYALLNCADPDQLSASTTKRKPAPGALTFLDKVAKRSGNSTATIAESTKDLGLISMLLDAGASPCVPGAANIALPYVCKHNWASAIANGYDELVLRALSAMLKRGGAACVDLRLDNKPALRLAAEAGNVDAVTQLMEAGANADPAILGADLFTLIKASGGEKHLPALTDLLIR